MILDKTQLIIENSQSIIAFKNEGGRENGDANSVFSFWDRYLTIDGQKVYQIGTACDTCAFFFEHIKSADDGVQTKITQLTKEVIDKLNCGLTTIEPSVIDTLKLIMPDGKYYVVLSQVTPTLVHPGHPGDYFNEEQTELIGYGYDVHNPKTEYYRLHTAVVPTMEEHVLTMLRTLAQRYELLVDPASGAVVHDDCGFFEFLVPLYSHDVLNKERVSYYENMLAKGKMPTAVTISVLDMHEPQNVRDENSPIQNHACLVHYLIDGHHKAYAAAITGKPLTLISFLALERGLSSEYHIDKCIKLLQALPK